MDDIFASDEYVKRIDKMNRYLKEYTGEWWATEKLNDYDSKVFINYIFSTLEHQAPLLTDNRPRWHVTARLPFMQPVLEIWNKKLDYLWDKLDLDMNLQMVEKDCLLWPVGLWKVYRGEDGTCVDVVDPRTFFIFSGYHDTWGCAGCGERKLVPISWINSNYPDAKVKADDGSDINLNKSDFFDFELEDKCTVVYEVWLKDDSVEWFLEDKTSEKEFEGSEKRKKYPNGRIIIFTRDEVLLSDEASPFKHGHPPYIPFYDYKVPHSFWGMCEPTQIEELNREDNKQLQYIVHFANTLAKKNFNVDGACGLDPETLKKTFFEGDNFYVSNPMTGGKAIEAIDVGILDMTHQNIIMMLSRFIEEETGVTDISKGMEVKKEKQTAREIATLIESTYTRIRQKVRNLEWSVKRANYLLLSLDQQYTDEPEYFNYKENGKTSWGLIGNNKQIANEVMTPGEQEPNEGEDDYKVRQTQEKQDYEEFLKVYGKVDKIYVDFDLEVQTNSTLPMDKQSLASLYLKLIEVKESPDSVIDKKALHEALRIPDSVEIMKRQEGEKQKIMAMKQGGKQ